MKASNTILATAVAVAAGLLSAGNASAATSARQFATNPTGICQGALPAFETAIRKRPLAVQNEGTQTAFVTCSFTSQGTFGASATNPTRVELYLNSTSGAATPISCTGVTGYASSTTSQYVIKNASAPANGGQTAVAWTAADFTPAGGTTFPSGLFSVSCSLPPGAAINDGYVIFAEEIGT